MGIILHDKTGDLHPVTFKKSGQTIVVQDCFVRNAVIANDGVGRDEELATVRRVGEVFRVPHHPGVEDDFTLCCRFVAKRHARPARPVFEKQRGVAVGDLAKDDDEGGRRKAKGDRQKE